MATTTALSTTPPEQRLCSEAALDALCNELTAYYFQRQEEVSPSAAVDAIGARWGEEREFNQSLACFFPLSTSTSTSSLPSLLPPHLTFATTPTQATASAAPSPSAPPSAVTGCDTRRRSTP